MNNLKSHIFRFLLPLICLLSGMAGGRAQTPVVTPVDVDDEKPRDELHYYDSHGNALKEPVRFVALLDTVQQASAGPVYPLYSGMNVGVNFGDLIMMAFGQKYASFDVWTNVSLHNWFFPTVEAGIGFADATPDKKNYTYHSSPSFYMKAGINYNFLYKSNPDYQMHVGVRAGFSSFSYSLTNVQITSEYWGQQQNFDMKSLHSTAIYGEVLAGVQVKIYKNFSLGWDLRWHFPFHTTKSNGSAPWYIPGCGGDTPLGFSASAIYTFPVKKKDVAEPL